MRSNFVVRCKPYRCAISTAAVQMDSGSRVRGGCSLRHRSNRWLSSNKSGGIATCGWDISQPTLHCIGESRIIAESSHSSHRARPEQAIEKPETEAHQSNQSKTFRDG